MPLILGTNSIKDTGYDVANSVRTNKADQPKGQVTQGTPTNADKYTFSVWVKRADLGASNSKIFSVSSGSTYGEEKLEFNQDDLIWRHTQASDGETVWERVTDRKFRDPSAWYHIVVAYDSSQGTAADRCKMYINGTEETSFSGSSNPSSDLDSYTNTSGRAFKFFTYHEDSNVTQDATAYFAEMVYIDGQQLDQTSFGEFDSDSPTIWKPKDVSGLTFGNNGFWLDFEDSSALGNDVSGNNNDLTFSNISATDQSTDTPTNNFCTINPLIIRTGRTAPTLSEGNLKCVHSDSGGNTPAWGTFLLTAGSWYWEVKVTTGNYSYIGIWQPQYDNGDVDDSLNGIVIYRQDGYKQAETAATAATYGDSYTGGSDIVSVAVNCDTGTIWFAKNGTWQASATEAEIEAGTTTNAAYTGKSFSKGIIPSISAYSGATHEYNFGSPPYSISSGNSDENGYGNFEYSVPDGFLAVCTKNLGESGG